MTHYNIINHHFHNNNGINKEQCLDFYLNGRHGKHDNLRWYEGSDLPEQRMSVKSARFSLTAGGQLKGESLEEMLTDFFARVASERFAYVTETYTVYEMNATEFREFMLTFGAIEKDSAKNGGRKKIKAKSESQRMIEWFEMRAR